MMEEPRDVSDLKEHSASGATTVPGSRRASWWRSQQAPPICPTCGKFCPCRHSSFQEDGRIQYRYCKTCDYRTKTIVPVTLPD
jgi:Pyruvate/2-oxoacid:ferredoxin oxidoreductase delta subunit